MKVEYVLTRLGDLIILDYANKTQHLPLGSVNALTREKMLIRRDRAGHLASHIEKGCYLT